MRNNGRLYKVMPVEMVSSILLGINIFSVILLTEV